MADSARALGKVLVTGGAGFIGSHLIELLTARGCAVVAYDNFRTGRPENLEGSECVIIEADILDVEALSAAMLGCDTVFHLAAQVSVPESMENPYLSEQMNAVGSRCVMEAARRAGVGKVVYASTCAVYGSVERPAHREADAPAPESVYAVTKLAGEHYVLMLGKHFGIATAAGRFFNVYGPRQSPQSAYAGVVSVFADRAAAGAALIVHGDGSQTRDFVSVKDIARALVALAELGDGVYNVCTERSISVLELAGLVRAEVNPSTPIAHEAPRAGDVLHSRGDASRLRALGFRAEVTLESGLRETLAWLDSQRAGKPGVSR